MKKTSIAAILIIISCALFMCACRQDPAPGPTPGPKPDVVTYDSEIEAMIVSKTITVTNTYKTDYFRSDSSVFNKDLALLSCSLAYSGDTVSARSALGAMYFDDIYDYWNAGRDVNGCSYAFGHRAVDNSELVVIYVFGLNYGPEWSGNLNLGTEEECNGDHLGFNLAAGTVYAELKDYIAKNIADKDLKIWICGYSRAGGISDVLACIIIEDKELKVEQKDMFVYTFEAPASISSQRVQKYDCIHNIVVEADLIPRIPPAAYGISRPETDVVLNADEAYINECLHMVLGEDVNMPAFTPDANSPSRYNTPAEFASYLVDCLINAKAEAGIPSLESRDTYVTTIQDRIRYLAEILMKDNLTGANGLMEYVREVSQDYGKMLQLVLVWANLEDGFYEGNAEYDIKGLKQILDECGVEYDGEKLKTACSLVPGLVRNENL